MRILVSVTSIHIEKEKIMSKVQSNKFWKKAAMEWWRLLDDYTPMKKGKLKKHVHITPKTIEYKEDYGHYQYVGRVMGPSIPISKHGNVVGFFSPTKVRKHYTGAMLKHLKGGPRWDVKARDEELPKLIDAMQKFIDEGGISFD